MQYKRKHTPTGSPYVLVATSVVYSLVLIERKVILQCSETMCFNLLYFGTLVCIKAHYG